MRHTFQEADFDALTKCWNSFYPPNFQIDSEVFRLNTVGSPVFDWGNSCFETEEGKVTGFIAVKRSANPSLYRGPELDQAHISAIAFANPNQGLEMMADIKKMLMNRGVNLLYFGQDSSHFFPGCPVDFPTLCNFLMIEGFAPGYKCSDVERDLTDFKDSVDVPAGASCKRLKAANVDELEDFLGYEFPGRWRHDTMKKVEDEGPGCVMGLFGGGQLQGFAMLQDFKQKHPVAGCVWRKSLGTNWGGLGPIGVAKALRGKGLGLALLGSSLQSLKDAGVRNCIIDWTGLVDFYGKFGFRPTRQYETMSLKLED